MRDSEEEKAIKAAQDAVAKTEESKLQSDVDAAQQAVNLLKDGEVKIALQVKIDAVQAQINAAKEKAALEKVYIKEVKLSEDKKTITVTMMGKLYFKDGDIYKELLSTTEANETWYKDNFKLNNAALDEKSKVAYNAQTKVFTITLTNSLKDNDIIVYKDPVDAPCYRDSEGKTKLGNIKSEFKGGKLVLVEPAVENK